MASGSPATTPIQFAQRNITNGESASVQDVKILDMEGDGDLDILTGNEAFTEWTILYENDGNQNFCQKNLANFRNVEVYDLDGDGDFDSFGATGAFDTEINWFENDGSNELFDELFISSDDPWTLTGGDLDSDGDIDLVAAILSSNLVWFSNDGSGNFSTKITIPSSFTGGSNSFFSVRDINSDGAMDILGYHENSRDLVWYENNGSQSFTEHPITTTTVRQRPISADVDSDGDIDIVTTNTSNPHSLTWLENDGTENFTEHTISVSAINNFEMVDVTDVDGDLDMDILAGGYWFENDGMENFNQNLISPGLIFGSNIYATGVDYADLDNDGDQDLISIGQFSWHENGAFMSITDHSPLNASVVTSNTDLSISFDQTIDNATLNSKNISIVSNYRGQLAGVFGGGGTNTITFDPVDNLIAGETIEVSINENLLSTSGHNMAINYGFSFKAESTIIGTPDFSSNPVLTHTDNVSGMDIADVDGDGDLDLLTCSFTELYWHENDGSGNFTSTTITTTATPTGVFAIDYNEDGFMDIIVNNSSFDPTLLYTNDGNQNFTESTFPGSPTIIQFKDINLDGDLDILTLTATNGYVGWGEFQCEMYSLSGNSIQQIDSEGVMAADLDNDGDIDLIGSSTLGPSYYENDGYLNFTNFSIDTNSTIDQELADLDGDGDLDALFIESFSAVIWYENRLNEVSQDFGSLQLIASLDQDPRDIEAVDLDGDGDMDIVAISKNDDKFVWYENRLNEVTSDFGNEQLLPKTAAGLITLESGDLDGDGDMDLITLSDADERVIWFENEMAACESPIVTAQPSSDQLCEGINHSLTVSASGSSLAFQWQKNQIDIPDATQPSLMLNSIASVDFGNYRCVISNSCGEISSAEATLSAIEAVSIQTQPQVQTTIDKNSQATFSINATGDNLTYQWQKDGNNIAGETSNIFTISSVSTSDEGDYRCIVSNECNSITSQPATLSVNQEQPLGHNNNQEVLTIYPNPSSSILNIQFEKNHNEGLSIIMQDLSGKEVMNDKKLFVNETIVTIDISSLSKGIYSLKMVTSTGSIYSERIIVE